ncbi:GntR family transcriptional regulator [Nonomuraea purpurea]|uniref:GntR family transcriptional regulator n=1 Tax=Nonomuraea purpurea TaxID=1849276 RepID=A0ABV8G5W2_9ACTN
MAKIQWNPELHKYEQIVRCIRDRIRTGVYPPHTILSEVQLQEEFEVSRPTIRQAMAVLRQEGLIVTLRGKGSVVRSQSAGGDILD